MKQRILLIVALAAFALNGCKTGSNSEAQAANSQSSSQQISIPDAVAKAQAAGELPVLDTTASLGGVDANHDLVRDDIETYISKQPYNEEQKAALRQLSVAYTSAITSDITNITSANAAYYQLASAIFCIVRRFPDGRSSEIISEFEEINANTYERTKSYLKWNKYVSQNSFEDKIQKDCI